MLNCPSIDQWHKSVPQSVRGPTLFGIAVLFVWIVGFGFWALWAPISGAVISSGAFVATGQNKLVQHLEGGIVREILVREGDTVAAGQALVRLDETAARSRLKRLSSRTQRLRIMQARLQAETEGREDFAVPAEIVPLMRDPEIAEVVARQRMEITARRSKVNAEIAVLKLEIRGIDEMVIGYNEQVKASRSQLESFREEIKDKRELLARALVRKPELLATQRAESRTSGEIAQLLSRVADSRERISRANQQMVQIQSSVVQRAIEDLRVTETELDDIREQIRAARDVVDRIEIVSPVKGIVVKLNQHTSGGVVAAGSVLMELLPIGEELIIEARVQPHEIVNVREGQTSSVRLSALNQRLTPTIAGSVAYVSADAVVDSDPRKQMMMGMHGTYVVRVRLDPNDVALKAPGFLPKPGMPADIYIETGDRTFFQYLLKPLLDSFSRAFREQ